MRKVSKYVMFGVLGTGVSIHAQISLSSYKVYVVPKAFVNMGARMSYGDAENGDLEASSLITARIAQMVRKALRSGGAGKGGAASQAK